MFFMHMINKCSHLREPEGLDLELIQKVDLDHTRVVDERRT